MFRFHPTTSLSIMELRKNQYKDREFQERLQFQRLKALLSHAYDNVPYYHDLFKRAGIKVDDIRNPNDIEKIPITRKKDIREARGFTSYLECKSLVAEYLDY